MLIETGIVGGDEASGHAIVARNHIAGGERVGDHA